MNIKLSSKEDRKNKMCLQEEVRREYKGVEFKGKYIRERGEEGGGGGK